MFANHVVWQDGRLCISILHPPGDDPTSGELASERWNPTQSVSTVLLSVISMLNEPNISSPANVDASVMYRNEREKYDAIVRLQVEESKNVAAREVVTVPTTVDQYVIKREEAEVDLADSSDDEKYVVEYVDSEEDDDQMSESDDTAEDEDFETDRRPEIPCRKRSADGEAADAAKAEGVSSQ